MFIGWIIQGTYRLLPLLVVRTQFYWYGKSGLPSYWRESWGSDLRGESEWRWEWPRHHRWDSTGFAKLNRMSITIQAYSTIIINVGMEHFCVKLDLGRLCWVLLSELQLELEQTSLPCCPLRTLDESAPKQQVTFLGWGVDALILVFCQLG
jgi:hypothetical protein